VIPIIKWCGGKTRLLPELRKRMPITWNRYYEPFAGGAALFFDVVPKDAVLSDTNQHLIGLYRELARDPGPMIRHLAKHRREHGKRHYYEVRERYNDPKAHWTPASKAAAFMYLNKSCFNGLHRVNKRGEFNVPMGDYKNPQIYDPIELRRAGVLLRGVDIRCMPYTRAVAGVTAGDLVYMDSPYDPVSKTASFTAYGQDGFTRDDQRILAATALELVHRGAYVMLSNSDTQFIRSLYRDKAFTIDRVLCPRAINSDISARGGVPEVIITGCLPTRRKDFMPRAT